MNRLILIGNGFDLAHGMKTSYNDFILWYIKVCFGKAHKERYYEDRLIKIRGTAYMYNEQQHSRWLDGYLSKVEHPKRRSTVSWSSLGDYERGPETNPFKIEYKSKLLEPLLNSCNVSNWVDIEAEYYELLKDGLEIKNVDPRQTYLNDLNESLKFIISQLELYLADLPLAPFLADYDSIFSSEMHGGDLYPKRSDSSFIPKQTYILNFNYTDTPQQYINRITVPLDGLSPHLNYIHGKLNDIDNELIFGFGDEIDTAYKRMEDDSKIKGYFDHVKSFWYLRTDNYRSLVNFLDSEDYQVFVLGHSCGLSDRTMLQMIFEHEKCRSIKIYYHEHDSIDNFVSQTHEIARHFTDKGLMRKKILSRKRSERMPQHDD